MRKLALVSSMSLFTSLLFPTPAIAVDPHGPKVIFGAPVRHTLTSCATNPGAAVACIQGVTLTPKSGDTPIVGAITDLKIPGDERVADSERPIPIPDAAAISSSVPTRAIIPMPEVLSHSAKSLPFFLKNIFRLNIYLSIEIKLLFILK